MCESSAACRQAHGSIGRMTAKAAHLASMQTSTSMSRHGADAQPSSSRPRQYHCDPSGILRQSALQCWSAEPTGSPMRTHGNLSGRDLLRSYVVEVAHHTSMIGRDPRSLQMACPSQDVRWSFTMPVAWNVSSSASVSQADWLCASPQALALQHISCLADMAQQP